MPEVVLESGRLRATVLPELGAGLGGLWYRTRARDWEPILRPAPAGATWFNDLACYLLAPWPNRIEGARFRWRGRDVVLTADWPDGTAIHGLIKEVPWTIEESSESAVALTAQGGPPSWPWKFACRVRYEVAERAFRTSLEILNVNGPDAEPMPCGIGFHPFFARPAGATVVVRAPVRARYPLTNQLPTAPPIDDRLSRELRDGRALEGEFLDEVFAGSPHGAEVRWTDRGLRAASRCSKNLSHTVLYSRGADENGVPPESFCLEPVSMVNNGFRLAEAGWEGTGVVSLAPGERLEAWWSLDIDEDR